MTQIVIAVSFALLLCILVLVIIGTAQIIAPYNSRSKRWQAVVFVSQLSCIIFLLHTEERTLLDGNALIPTIVLVILVSLVHSLRLKDLSGRGPNIQ